MRKHHPQNERIKRDYLTYLEHSGRMSASSVDQIASAISLFEAEAGRGVVGVRSARPRRSRGH